MTAFAVWGYIAAPWLPHEAQIGGAHIKRQDEQVLRDMPKSRTTMKHAVGGPPELLSVLPADSLVRSRWTVFFRVEAADADAAVAVVEGERLPALVAACAAVFNEAVAVSLVRVAEEDSAGRLTNSHSPWSLSLRTRGFTVSPAEPAAIDRASRLALVVPRDPLAKKAAALYSDALRLDELNAGLAPLQAAALLGYYKVIEAVAVSHSRGLDPADAEGQQREVVERLRRGLAGSGGTSNRARQVLNAADELRRVQGAFLSQRVAAAGSAIGVAAEDVRAAVDLGKLRNTSLSHPGKSATGDLGPYLPPAERAARGYLSAHLLQVIV